MKNFIVKAVDSLSIAEEMEIQPGDKLLRINDQKVNDILDYRYLIADEELFIEIEKNSGEIWELEIEKEYEEDMGLHFEEDVIEIKTCRNNCVFCFIDQLPEGLRETLYIKDDDERLSFLTGNYITLTNLTDEEVKRILAYRIMPMNLSIHTTNPELRCRMLNNRFAGNVMEYLDCFKENGIQMNGQIVLVPGYNDEAELIKTLDDLKAYFPQLQSVSVVPVGLSDHREGLEAIEPFDQKKAARTIEIINRVHNEMVKKHGTGFVYPSDEFFLMAKIPIPDSSYYDEFMQIENGVGMIADFRAEFQERLKESADSKKTQLKTGILTGEAAFEEMKNLLDQFKEYHEGSYVEVFPIANHVFGSRITVSGLMTGKDIVEQIKPVLAKKKLDRLLIPENALKNDSELLLDDYTLSLITEELGIPVIKTAVNGRALVDTLLEKV